MDEAAKNAESRIVLALDFPFQNPENPEKLLAKALSVLEAVHPYICAVKINHHLVLPLGTFDGVQKLIKKTHEAGLLAIMDCKANDIGATNQVIAEYYYRAGFDALIANPFVGWEEGLKPIFDVARKLQRGVILLAYMSHKGAAEGYGQTICDCGNRRENKTVPFLRAKSPEVERRRRSGRRHVPRKNKGNPRNTERKRAHLLAWNRCSRRCG